MYGVYTITKRKAEFIDGEWVAGEIVEVIDNIRNNITPYYVQTIYTLVDNNGNIITAAKVAVSEAQHKGALAAKPSSTGWVVGSVANDATYTAAAGMDDAYWEIQTTVNPPATVTRNIRTLALTGTNTNISFSVVSLSAPCPQTTTEILQINYRLVIDLATITANSSMSGRAAAETLREQLIPISTSGLTDTDRYLPFTVFSLPYDSTRYGDGIVERHITGLIGTNAGTSEIIFVSDLNYDSLGPPGPQQQGLRKYSITAQFGLNDSPTANGDHTGYPLKSIGIGGGQCVRNFMDVSKGTVSSVQNTFGRSADDSQARPPFLDNNIIATSAAGINIQDIGNWVNHRDDSYNQPYLYRITMETGGLTGTATYKVRRKRLGRTIDNSPRWLPIGINIPTTASEFTATTIYEMDGPNTAATRHGQTMWGIAGSFLYDNINSTRYGGNLLYVQYVYPDFINFDYTGLSITGINGQFTNLDTNSTTALSVTGVLQVATDGSTILVADEDTGLWMVNRDIGDYDTANYNVTQLIPPGLSDATSCRGVAVKGAPWAPNPVTYIRVVDGGYNYAVNDTVTIVGANGTSATAEVNEVDADGTIISVNVTAAGSGYIMDNIQAYVSSGSGVGASLEVETGSDGDWWALFDDVTDSILYLANATLVGSNNYSSGLTFATAGDTITRTDGTSFITDGFRVGQKLIVKDSENSGENDGVLSITAVTATVITVSDNLTDSTGADTTAQIRGVSWEVMRSTITTTETLQYTDNGASADTITGTGTSFITQGFVEGMKIVISVSTSNDGIYTIADVTATVITLDVGDALVSEGPNSDTMAALTDFTITNYTSGTPGRTGIIGLILDPRHADYRFLMLTPATKYVNDGVTAQLNGQGGFDWWSHANSTGTTTAGTTDRVRVGSSQNNMSLAGEQIATVCAAPLSLTNGWITMDLDGEDSNHYTAWGGTGATTETDGVGATTRPMMLINKSMENTVVGLGAVSANEVSTRQQNSEMVSASFDTVLAYDWTVSSIADDYSASANVAPFTYFGKGMFGAWIVGDSQTSGGTYSYSFNGTGLLADEDLMPYGFWDEFGWDGTRWVLGNASAKTTHSAATFAGSNLNFNVAGTILGTFTGTDWAGDGFAAGDQITIASAGNAVNNGTYTIESLSGTTLTITPDGTLATDATDTTATVTGSTALIDGISIEFDDNGATDPFVVNEYYDTHLFDGILNDNATKATFDVYAYSDATASGTDYADNDGTAAAGLIDSGTVGAVTNEPWASVNHGIWGGLTTPYYYSDPGLVCSGFLQSITDLHMSEQELSGDFAFRFKVAGSDAGNTMQVGVVPWIDVDNGTDVSTTALDHNVEILYDKTNFPLLDQYSLVIRDEDNSAILHTHNADRVMLDTTQDYLNFDDGASNGDFEAGSGHTASDIITMDDGSTITVDAVSTGQITQWSITTQATASSGRTERIVTDDSANLDFLDGGGSADTITGDGTSFITLGFKPGMKIWVRTANTAANDGNYTIAEVTATIITLITSDVLTTDATDVTAVMSTAITQASTSGGGIDFAFTLGTNNEVISDLGNDTFKMERIGTSAGNLRWSVNDVEFYRHTGTLNTVWGGAITHQSSSWGLTMYDAEFDYTIARTYLRVGNGTTTGANDSNFRTLPPSMADIDITLTIAGSAATILTDGVTPPAAGEVNILAQSGRLWFNNADQGAAVTGTWTIVKRINIV